MRLTDDGLDIPTELRRTSDSRFRSETAVLSDGRKAGPQHQSSGVNAAARELGVSKADAHRALKVASLSPEAKQAARDVGLDDNRSALLEAAKETQPEKQVETLKNRASKAAAKKADKPKSIAGKRKTAEVISIAQHRSRKDEACEKIARAIIDISSYSQDASDMAHHLRTLDVGCLVDEKIGNVMTWLNQFARAWQESTDAQSA